MARRTPESGTTQTAESDTASTATTRSTPPPTATLTPAALSRAGSDPRGLRRILYPAFERTTRTQAEWESHLATSLRLCAPVENEAVLTAALQDYVHTLDDFAPLVRALVNIFDKTASPRGAMLAPMLRECLRRHSGGAFADAGLTGAWRNIQPDAYLDEIWTARRALGPDAVTRAVMQWESGRDLNRGLAHALIPHVVKARDRGDGLVQFDLKPVLTGWAAAQSGATAAGGRANPAQQAQALGLMVKLLGNAKLGALATRALHATLDGLLTAVAPAWRAAWFNSHLAPVLDKAIAAIADESARSDLHSAASRYAIRVSEVSAVAASQARR